MEWNSPSKKSMLKFCRCMVINLLVMGSSRFITICLKVSPFNVTITQVYCPTHDHDSEEIEKFYTQFHDVINQTRKT